MKNYQRIKLLGIKEIAIEINKMMIEVANNLKEKDIVTSIDYIEQYEKRLMKECENCRDFSEIVYDNLNERIDKIEKILKIKGAETFIEQNIKEMGEFEQDADAMFKELGYDIDDDQEDGSIQYCKKGCINKDDYEFIIINIYKENKEWIYWKQKDYDMDGITKAEQKAINRKIEELEKIEVEQIVKK